MSNNTYTAKETSFWKFIQENEIEIPIIQRDYAQGRLGEENLRKNFLADLKKALDNEKLYNDKAMKMDFVYGSVEHDKMNPLDGQQRLTTLWLLHWYIALRAGELNEENCTIFRKFTYETRISSREFCGNLCNPEHFKEFDGTDIVGFITRQTWFYSAWKQDPTIQSMLRMLGGTKVRDIKGEDIVDGIEGLFVCPPNCEIQEGEKCVIYRKFNEYWHKLTGDNCPIVFYHLPLKDFGLSDDLYIKMNARGKQLTSFENFKADLVDYIMEQSNSELLGDDAKINWKSLLDEIKGIPIKMDTAWTDIFWKHKSKDYKIDDIYFAFLNRFFLNELICLKDEKRKEGEKTELKYKFTADYLEKENKTFKYLYGNKGDDSKLNYNDLSIYQYSSDKIPFQLFDSLQKTLNKYSDILKKDPKKLINDYFPKWVFKSEFNSKDKFEFIPKYNEEGITILRQKERIIFLAVCRYFEKCSDDFDDKRFEQWMRVVWNIVENSGIDTISAMIGAMRLINELSEHSHTIYEFLSDSNSIIESDFAKDQVEEEIAKAKKIVEDSSWEKIIKEAEECKYLKGKIWVLFQNGDNTELEQFKLRLDLLNAIIENPDEYYLPKILLSYYDKQKPETTIELKNSEKDWKTLLTDNKRGLFSCFQKIQSNSINADIRYQWIKDLSTTQLLNNSRNDAKIVGSYGRNRIVLWGTSGCRRYVFANEVWGNVIIGNNRTLLMDGNFELQDKNIVVPQTNFVYYFDVNFKYNNNFFQWYGNPNDSELDVYLMNGIWCDYKRRSDFKEGRPDKDNYYCFEVNDTTNLESFKQMLNNLIQEAEAHGQPCYNECQNKINSNLYENTEH